MLRPVQNTTSFQTMLVALVSEFMAETERKRGCALDIRGCMMDPAICGIPVEASRGVFEGWYAQNGVTLKIRLGFVCVSGTNRSLGLWLF